MPLLPGLVTGGLLSLLAAAPARAQGGVLSEVRLGASAHDVRFGGGPREGGIDLNAEALFVSPVPDAALSGVPPALRWLLQPRPMLGVGANTAGRTSQGYAGVTLTTTLVRDVLAPGDAILFDAGEAAAVNDGHVARRGNRFERLGSNVLFRSSADLGYRISPCWVAYLEIDHESNAGLARDNEGLTQVGMRIGLRF